MFSRSLRVKRVFDFIVGVSLVLALLPLFVVVALLIKLTSGGPVLFRQQRVGHRGEPFTMLKFRTMPGQRDDSELREQIRRELSGNHVPDKGSYKPTVSSDVTALGRWLRRASLDELP